MMCCQEPMGEEFLEEIKPNSKAPWSDALAKIDDDSLLLSEKIGDISHARNEMHLFS